ncbi:hypothetical protein [Mucilaginibacter sp. CAU 1740]|uniref:hypothetical protein n=1 Tax=Mucilaginibacter sp. CAU 1740 TaxID=3140365 RepID=UPI00325C0072
MQLKFRIGYLLLNRRHCRKATIPVLKDPLTENSVQFKHINLGWWMLLTKLQKANKRLNHKHQRCDE